MKINMITTLRDLIEKVDNIQEHKGNVSGETEMPRKSSNDVVEINNTVSE